MELETLLGPKGKIQVIYEKVSKIYLEQQMNFGEVYKQ